MIRRALVSLLLGAAACSAPPPRPAPPSTASARPIDTVAPTPAEPKRASLLPTPPSQNAPWQAPAGVDEARAGAVRALFDLGVGDPRGLPYRSVTIPVGDVWQGASADVETGGFVLPKGAGPQHCVLWNGLVHPCADAPAGAARTVEGDVLELAKRDGEERAKYMREHPGSDFHRFPAASEAWSVATTAPSATKIALLLRLGRPDLAAKVQAALGPPSNAQTVDGELELFVAVAADWLWARYDRAVNAHMARRDELARASLEGLEEAGKRADAICDQRKVPRRSADPGKPAPSHFGFLDNVGLLAADQERRARSPRKRADLGALATVDAKARIEALIAELEEVDERQWGQPGGVSLGSSPIVAALAKEGDAAVEPLLAVLESDVRLTRSVHFWRDFARHRSPLGVHEAAYVALSTILDVSAFTAVATGDDLSARGPEGRKAVVAALRAHAAKWKGVPIEERWFRILADDSAKPAQWIEAANSATIPSNVTVVRTSMVFSSTMTTSGPPTGLKGESLRKHAKPSLTELLTKRTREAPSPAERCALGHALVAWDAVASEGPARALFADVTRAELGGARDLRRCISALTADRSVAKHKGALAEYAAWIERAAPPDGSSFSDLDVFRPMAEHAGDPDVARAAGKIFAKGSPWLPTPTKLEYGRAETLKLPLVIRPLRARVLEYLDEKAEVGTSVVREGGGLSMEMTNGSSVGTSTLKDDPRLPAPNTKSPIRACDYVAWEILHTNDALHVPFAVYWNVAQRDEAIAHLKAAIRALP